MCSAASSLRALARAACTALCAALWVGSPPVLAATEARHALVIGNARYAEAPLTNPVNDARAMAGRLAALGFEVSRLENATLVEMKTAVADFGARLLKQPDAAALFYFAGHGIQSRGANYLMPVDASTDSEARARAVALELDDVLEELQYRGKGVNIVILDACRNNPFESSVRGRSRGLARVKAARGTLVAYATEPGAVAEDGDGRNGVYTQALLEALSEPGLNEDRLFKQVGALVEARTGGQQRPWREGSLRGDFIFNAPVNVTVEQATLTPAPANVTDREALFWDSIKDSDNAGMFEEFLRHFPAGTFAGLARLRLAELREPPQVAASRPAPAEPDPEAARRERIAALLAAAAADVEALRLTSPASSNAVARYRQVLALDEGNGRAVAGLAAVVDSYIELAERSAARGNRDGIRRYLDRAATVQPDSEAVEAARERLLAVPTAAVAAVAPETSPATPAQVRPQSAATAAVAAMAPAPAPAATEPSGPLAEPPDSAPPSARPGPLAGLDMSRIASAEYRIETGDTVTARFDGGILSLPADLQRKRGRSGQVADETALYGIVPLTGRPFSPGHSNLRVRQRSDGQAQVRSAIAQGAGATFSVEVDEDWNDHYCLRWRLDGRVARDALDASLGTRVLTVEVSGKAVSWCGTASTWNRKGRSFTARYTLLAGSGLPLRSRLTWQVDGTGSYGWGEGTTHDMQLISVVHPDAPGQHVSLRTAP